MNCTEAKRHILDGQAASPDLVDHLSRCPACATLAEDGGDLARLLRGADAPTAQGLPPDLLSAVQQDLRGEARLLNRPRSWSTPVRLCLAICGAGIVVLSSVLTLRSDLGLYPLARLGLELAVLLAMALAAVWLWLRPLHRPALPGWIAPTLIALAVAVPWGLAALPAAHHHPASLLGTGDDLAARAAACFLYGSLIGLPVILLVVLLGRGARGLIRLAVFPAVAGGLSGLVALHLHCPLTSPLHLLAGHAPIVLGLVSLGALIARAISAQDR